jgi:hypothetical protein
MVLGAAACHLQVPLCRGEREYPDPLFYPVPEIVGYGIKIHTLVDQAVLSEL